MFDVFYSGVKPNQFIHEREADSIEHAQSLCRTRYFWWISYLCDYTEWDWLWEPVPWQATQRHAWPSQWQKNSGTYLIPKSGYTDTNYHPAPSIIRVGTDSVNWSIPTGIASFDTTWHPDPTDPPYIYQFGTQHQRTGGPQYRVPGAVDLKFVDQIRVTASRVATAIYEIDHMDGAAGQITNTTRRVRYFDNYRDTLIRLARSIGTEHEFVWVCSSICDYTDFDFSWHPEQWQASMLHVFASDGEKFGDTFFMHVSTFAEYGDRKDLLEWYDVNYVNKSVPRRLMPVIEHEYDSHVEIVKTTDWAGPLALFTTNNMPNMIPTVSLWRKETKNIVPLDAGANAVIVPKVATVDIRTQLYDYPYIDKTYRKTGTAQLQDIVFISYDEPEADINWELLKSRHPRAVRVHGVSGMELALEAAADVSTTSWYYAVFAKTRLYEDFDFSFAPDRMQQPKHYIFNCRNSSNGLEYGHMGMVLYNCNGIRETNRFANFGLDYTLSFPHESIPLLSCYGDFATTPYHAWRTAFRETAKLAYFETATPSVDNSYRLTTWLNKATGNNAEWVLKGAKDGLEFFNGTQGDLEKLKQSFRWEWLRDYFKSRYGDLK